MDSRAIFNMWTWGLNGDYYVMGPTRVLMSGPCLVGSPEILTVAHISSISFLGGNLTGLDLACSCSLIMLPMGAWC